MEKSQVVILVLLSLFAGGWVGFTLGAHGFHNMLMALRCALARCADAMEHHGLDASEAREGVRIADQYLSEVE